MNILKKYQNSINQARIALNEAAATTDELTRQMKATTEFKVPVEGIQAGTLLFKLRSHGAVNVKVVQTGDTYSVSTTNPTQVAKILKELGLVAEVDGTVDDLQTKNIDVALSNDSTTGTIGESYMKRFVKRCKTAIGG